MSSNLPPRSDDPAWNQDSSWNQESWNEEPAPPSSGSEWEPEARHTPRSHRHGPPTAAGPAHTHVPGNLSVSAHTRRVVLAILVPAAIATLIGLILLWPDQVSRPAPPEGQVAYGEVITVIETTCPPGLPPGTNQVCGEADIRLTEGAGAGSVVTVELPVGPGAPSIAEGDEVVLNYLPASELGPARYSVVDHQRGQQLIFLLALCGAVVVAFGRWRGLTAIVGLAVSFGVLLNFVIPGILEGSNPLLIAIVGSAAIMFAVLYLTHGVNVHTSVAILGTLMALVLTGLLGAAFTGILHLTGFGSEETLYLSMSQSAVDMRGLLLAGIIIGALGVLDDVTVTQATTVAELARSPMSRFDLYRSAARVGRAHIASAVNTIVLAYAGASLPLLLLVSVSGTSLSEIVSGQLLAQEIVRSAVGTIGLVAAVPITTALAALVADRDPRPTD